MEVSVPEVTVELAGRVLVGRKVTLVEGEIMVVELVGVEAAVEDEDVMLEVDTATEDGVETTVVKSIPVVEATLGVSVVLPDAVVIVEDVDDPMKVVEEGSVTVVSAMEVTTDVLVEVAPVDNVVDVDVDVVDVDVDVVDDVDTVVDVLNVVVVDDAVEVGMVTALESLTVEGMTVEMERSAMINSGTADYNAS